MKLARPLIFTAFVMTAATARADVPPPSKPIRQAQPQAQGSIDKEVIRRVIRAHISEVRRCYETGLKQKTDLRGRVNVNWRIETDGRVSNAKVQNSTLQHEPTEACIVAAVGTWKFPKPVGGFVSITYPFAFESGVGAESDQPAQKPNQADPLRSR